jgi:hypothetical protein
MGPSVSKLPADEWITEFEWLLDNGSSVFMACEALGKNLASAERFLYRHNRHDLALQINQASYAIKFYQKAG